MLQYKCTRMIFSLWRHSVNAMMLNSLTKLSPWSHTFVLLCKISRSLSPSWSKKSHSKNLSNWQLSCLTNPLLMQTFQLNFWELKQLIFNFKGCLKNILTILDVQVFYLIVYSQRRFLKWQKNCHMLTLWKSGICRFWTPVSRLCSSQLKKAINANRQYEHFSGCRTPTLSLFSKAVGRVISSNRVIFMERKVSDHKAQWMPWISESSIPLKYLPQLSILLGNAR